MPMCRRASGERALLSRASHLVEITIPARSPQALGNPTVLLPRHELAQRPFEDGAGRPETRQLAGTSDELLVEDHVGAFHTPFVHLDGARRQACRATARAP